MDFGSPQSLHHHFTSPAFLSFYIFIISRFFNRFVIYVLTKCKYCYTAKSQLSGLSDILAILSHYKSFTESISTGHNSGVILQKRIGCGPLRKRQEHFYREQLKLARRHGLPVIVHVRRSVDQVLRGLRDIGVAGGIAHAFNGSRQQADAFLGMGFKLGFGGAVTYDRATRLRALAAELPPEAIVMETDAPDIPPHWLYATAEQRAAGAPQGRNEPAELPRIAGEVARLRGVSSGEWAATTTANALAALPRLARL